LQAVELSLSQISFAKKPPRRGGETRRNRRRDRPQHRWTLLVFLRIWSTRLQIVVLGSIGVECASRLDGD